MSATHDHEPLPADATQPAGASESASGRHRQIIDLGELVALERLPESGVEERSGAVNVFWGLYPAGAGEEVLGIGGEEDVWVQGELPLAGLRVVAPVPRPIDLRGLRIRATRIESTDDQRIAATRVDHRRIPAPVHHVLLLDELLGLEVEGVERL